MILSTPLKWPTDVPMRDKSKQKNGQFKHNDNWISIPVAVGRLQDELALLGARNAELRANFNENRGNVQKVVPKDCEQGVIVTFDVKGVGYVLPCDTYSWAADNIAALAAHIKATRAIERHGVATTAQALEAFAALPPRGNTPSQVIEQPKPKRPWYEVLSLFPTAPIEVAEAAYRALAKKHHPDAGGDKDAFQDIQNAIEEARKELS